MLCPIFAIIYYSLYSYFDTTKAKVFQHDGAIWGPKDFFRSVPELIHDDKWLETEYQALCVNRNKLVNDKLGRQGDLSTAAALVDLLCDWWRGSEDGRIYSVAIWNQDSAYNLPDDLVITLPLIFDPKGFWAVVKDFDMDEWKRSRIMEICKVKIKTLNLNLLKIFPEIFYIFRSYEKSSTQHQNQELQRWFMRRLKKMRKLKRKRKRTNQLKRKNQAESKLMVIAENFSE